MVLRLTLYIFTAFFFISVKAQQQVKLNIRCIGNNCEEFSEIRDAQLTETVFEAETFMKSLIEKAQQKGFISACYDSVLVTDTIISAIFIPGNVITLANIRFIDTEKELLKKAGIQARTYENTVLTTEKIKQLFRKIITYYENNGYPFARVSLSELQYTNDTLQAVFHCEKGRKIFIDTVANKGNMKIYSSVLFALIQISPKQPYDEIAISDISKLVKNHRFIRERTPAQIIFSDKGARVNLFFDKRAVNTFDGIVGFMPDYQNEGKLFLTGELMLSITNSMHIAENIRLKWRHSERYSQELKAGFSLPWLIHLPFGFSWDFFLLKKDTSYISVDNKFMLHYSKNHITKTGIYYQHIKSNLISIKKYENYTKLPPVSDMNISAVGLNIEHKKADNIHNPHKGLFCVFDISGGKKIIVKNSGLNDAVYKDAELNTLQLKAVADMNIFIPLKPKNTFLFRSYSGIVHSRQLFYNELFRLGGINDLRGFDENMFYASKFSMKTIEFRYLFEENSRFVMFADGAYVERSVLEDFLIQRHIGIGAGVVFETVSGVFSLFFASGKTDKQPFNLKSPKIHFGYVAVF